MEAGRGGYLYLKQSRHDFEARVPSAHTRENNAGESFRSADDRGREESCGSRFRLDLGG